MLTDELLHTRRPIKSEATAELGRTAFTSSGEQTQLEAGITSVSTENRVEIAKSNPELYEVVRAYVAPVIASFADYLLREAGTRQVIFSARDGIGSMRAAHILKAKFDYENDDPKQVVYAYLNRKVVGGTPVDILARHLQQAGVCGLDKSALLADIGMYGSVVPSVREVMPRIEPCYLVSKNPEIPGYASTADSTLSSFDSISGNPAVHFMEDTFSGPIASPTSLIDVKGWLIPDTIEPNYPPEEALKRKCALAAISDYVRSLHEPPEQPAHEAISKWNEFLGQQDNYAHFMVPHEG